MDRETTGREHAGAELEALVRWLHRGGEELRQALACFPMPEALIAHLRWYGRDLDEGV